MGVETVVGAEIPFVYQFVAPATQQPASPSATPVHRITPIGGSDLAYSGVVTSLGSGSYQLVVSATPANGFSAGGFTVRASALYSAIGYRGAVGAFTLASAAHASASPSSIVDLIDEAINRLSEQRAALADVPTVSEFNARTLVAADYFDPAADTVATVTTLTNAPSDSSGVTTLLSRLSAARAGYLDNLSAGAVALASKLTKYVQLLARKDAAIATDNATELTAINADGGSGAGTYDNVTDSVEGIRDTAPLGTAMRGTDSAALASVATEARLAELDAANLPADVDAILVDTGTTLPAEHAALPTAAENRAEMDTNSTQLAAIVADTNELQTDWANGGRLDLLLDAVSTHGVADVWAYVMTDATVLTADSTADHLRKLSWVLYNKMAITDATGAYTTYKDDGTTTAATGTITDDSTTTTRSAPTWA